MNLSQWTKRTFRISSLLPPTHPIINYHTDIKHMKRNTFLPDPSHDQEPKKRKTAQPQPQPQPRSPIDIIRIIKKQTPNKLKEKTPQIFYVPLYRGYHRTLEKTKNESSSEIKTKEIAMPRRLRKPKPLQKPKLRLLLYLLRFGLSSLFHLSRLFLHIRLHPHLHLVMFRSLSIVGV